MILLRKQYSSYLLLGERSFVPRRSQLDLSNGLMKFRTLSQLFSLRDLRNAAMGFAVVFGGIGVLGTVDELNGQGLLIFSETTRMAEILNFAGRPVGRDYTLVHEIGHLFYGLHGDGGVMSDMGTDYHPTTIRRMRGIVHH